DASAADRDEQIAAVNKVLEEIGAGDLEQLMVFNKVDLTAAPTGIKTDAYGRIVGLALSAQTGAGVAELRQFLKDRARQESRDCAGSAASPEEGLEHGLKEGQDAGTSEAGGVGAEDAQDAHAPEAPALPGLARTFLD
ncbi:MAG: hypothetical protein ABIP08_00340, partial [Lautropia sp.]